MVVETVGMKAGLMARPAACSRVGLKAELLGDGLVVRLDSQMVVWWVAMMAEQWAAQAEY